MPRPTFRHAILPAAFLLLGLAHTANAQDAYFANNATINYTVNGTAYVGYANQADLNNGTNPTSPTVALVTGGSIGGYLDARNSSTINVSSGSIASSLIASESNTVNVSGGSIGGGLYAYDSGTINLFGVGLKAVLTNPNYGDYSKYTLMGSLNDGTSVNGKFLYLSNGSNARFTLNNPPPPKPRQVTPFVGLVGAGLLLGKRRGSRKRQS